MTSGQLKRKSPVKMSLKQKFEAFELMRDNIEKIENTEFYKYLNGYTDIKIAEEVGCTKQSIHYIRKNEFGDIRKPKRRGNNKTDQVVKLEIRVTRLERELAVTNTKLNLLVGTIKVDSWKEICKSAENITDHGSAKYVTGNEETLFSH